MIIEYVIEVKQNKVLFKTLGGWSMQIAMARNSHRQMLDCSLTGLGHDWDGSVVKDSTSTSPSSGVEVSSHSPGTPEMF